MPNLCASPLLRLRIVLAAGIMLLHGAPVAAQQGATIFRATRPDLEARVAALDAAASSRDSAAEARGRASRDAERLRERLRDGDFQVGDRIVLVVPNDAALTDTFSVAPGRLLPLRNFGTVSLAGVLRAELEHHLRGELARYFKEPQVTATALVRLGVLGAVTRPGYYALSPDLVVTDVVMQAGGPTGEADLARATVRRGSRELWNSADLRIAMREGQTLDAMNLIAGDEIVVGQRRQMGWSTILQATTVLLAVVGLAASLASN